MIDINALGIEQLKKIGKMWNKEKLYNNIFDELKNFGIILRYETI